MTETEIDAALAGLKKLGHDQSGWDTLYRDPASDKLWEVTYPESQRHGGGPRQLSEISSSAAGVKYASALLTKEWNKLRTL